MFATKNDHFFNFHVTVASESSVSTGGKYSMWLFAFFEKTALSSRYTNEDFHFTDVNMLPITRENVAGWFPKPADIRSNWKSSWLLVNAVFNLSRLSISICQYDKSASYAEKILASLRASMHFFILCREYESLTVTALRWK